MKRIIIIAALAAIISAPCLMLGCKQGPQRVAYTTIASVEATASAALDGYYTAVIKGYARTNEVPEVAQRFRQLQAGLMLATAAAEQGTNAIAPVPLAIEAADLTAFIATLKNSKPNQ